MTAKLPVAILALAILAPAFLAPAASADERTKAFEELLPAETIVVVTIHDIEEFRNDFQKTGLYKIWAEPEMRAFFDTVWGGIEPFYAEWSAEMEKETGISIDEILEVLRGEVAFAFTGMDPETGMPGIAVTVEAKKNLPAAIRIVTKLREKIQAENREVRHSTRQIDGVTIETIGDEEFQIHYASFAEGFYFATTATLIDQLVNASRGEGAATLAASPNFTAVKDRLALDGEDYLLYANTAQALATFGDQMPTEARQALENAGLAGWEGIGIAGSFGENEWRESLTIHAPEDRRGLSVLFQDPGKVDLGKAEKVPANAESFVAFRFQPVEFYEEVLATVERFDAAAGEDVREGIREFESEFNLSLKDDLLGALSGEFLGFGFRPEGGSLLANSINVLGLEDPERFQTAIDKLLEGQDLFEVKSMEYRGRTIRYLLAPMGELGENPFEQMESEEGAMLAVLQFTLGSMAWYVQDGQLVTSNLTQALKDYVDFIEEGTGNLAGNSEFQAAAGRAGDAGGFFWSDLRPTVAQLYNTVLPFFRALEGFGRRAGVALDSALLPRAKTITSHMAPTHYVARFDGQGVTLEGVSLFPGTLLGLSTAAVGAAVAIPALLQARVGANETAAMATLRTFSTAQEQFKMQAVVDVDGDGTGEYGFVQELAGTSKGRAKQVIDPPFVNPEWGRSAAANGGILEANGYYFRVFLPGKDEATGEAATLPAGSREAADAQEARWVAYAWPVQFERTGRRVFVINEAGQIYESHNYGTMYSGLENTPPADAAYDLDGAGKAANLETGIATGGGRSGDGNFWMETYR